MSEIVIEIEKITDVAMNAGNKSGSQKFDLAAGKQ